MAKYVSDKDLGLNKILRGLNSVRGKEVTIGLHADLGVHPGENNDSNLTYAQIGAIQEYGATRRFLDGATIEIPPRPFTATAFDRNRARLNSDIKIAISKGMVSGNFMTELLSVGTKHAIFQKTVMEAWQTPPNSQRTIRYKGFNDPLKWTGAMISAVKAKIGR